LQQPPQKSHLGKGTMRKIILVLPLHGNVQQAEERDKPHDSDRRRNQVEPPRDEGEREEEGNRQPRPGHNIDRGKRHALGDSIGTTLQQGFPVGGHSLPLHRPRLSADRVCLDFPEIFQPLDATAPPSHTHTHTHTAPLWSSIPLKTRGVETCERKFNVWEPTTSKHRSN